MKKYHSEKDPFRDRTIIYDEHGKKVGYSEKAIFGDHVNVLASGVPNHILSGVLNQLLSEAYEPIEECKMPTTQICSL